MATLDPHVAAPPSEAPSGVQPGGVGRCVRLELAWGRCRRALLRRFRPGYVRRMASLRQGGCPDCPHDVIDARDLKFCRNVCGYHFGPDRDPYRGRRLLPLARAGLAEACVFSALLAAAAVLVAWAGAALSPWLWLALVPVLLVWAEVVYFFRDPERTIPADPAALVSPADGTVTDVGVVEDPDFPGGRALRVSIFLSIFNVHVNRVPRTGRVAAVRYVRGCFLDARRAECAQRNEQLWVDFEEADPPRRVRVKQIAGAIARRIVCWLRPGEEVRAGDRYGMIKFGSRTDVLVAAADPVEIQVKPGDRVIGGISILLRFR